MWLTLDSPRMPQSEASIYHLAFPQRESRPLRTDGAEKAAELQQAASTARSAPGQRRALSPPCMMRTATSAPSRVSHCSQQQHPDHRRGEGASKRVISGRQTGMCMRPMQSADASGGAPVWQRRGRPGGVGGVGMGPSGSRWAPDGTPAGASGNGRYEPEPRGRRRWPWQGPRNSHWSLNTLGEAPRSLCSESSRALPLFGVCR